MKSFFYSIALTLFLFSSVFASKDSLDTINLEIEHMLVPFQGPYSTARFRFNALDKDFGYHVALNAFYSKRGLKNDMKLDIDQLSFYLKGFPFQDDF